MLKKTILFITVLTLIAAGAVFAGNKPLELKSTSPEEGEMNVAVDTAIVLGFSSNVVNMKIAENNAECFSMVDQFSNEVEIEVYLPDDQLEPENKRTITLTPVQPLNPNMKYTVIISEQMLAKNGNALGEEKSFSFITAE